MRAVMWTFWNFATAWHALLASQRAPTHNTVTISSLVGLACQIACRGVNRLSCKCQGRICVTLTLCHLNGTTWYAALQSIAREQNSYKCQACFNHCILGDVNGKRQSRTMCCSHWRVKTWCGHSLHQTSRQIHWRKSSVLTTDRRRLTITYYSLCRPELVFCTYPLLCACVPLSEFLCIESLHFVWDYVISYVIS